MNDEYSIEALEQDIAHLMNDIKARDTEIARLHEVTTTRIDRLHEKLAKTSVEATAALDQANDEIARLRAENETLHLWAVAAYNQLVYDNVETGPSRTTQLVLDSAPKSVWESSASYSMTEFVDTPPEVQGGVE